MVSQVCVTHSVNHAGGGWPAAKVTTPPPPSHRTLCTGGRNTSYCSTWNTFLFKYCSNIIMFACMFTYIYNILTVDFTDVFSFYICFELQWCNFILSSFSITCICTFIFTFESQVPHPVAQGICQCTLQVYQTMFLKGKIYLCSYMKYISCNVIFSQPSACPQVKGVVLIWRVVCLGGVFHVRSPIWEYGQHAFCIF